MFDLESVKEGTVLPVRAQPGSKRNELRGAIDGALKVCVTQVAEKGKANQAIRDLLCKQLKLAKSQVELLCGETARTKKFLIRIPQEELAARLNDVFT